VTVLSTDGRDFLAAAHPIEDTAVFMWMNSHRSTPQGAAGHNDFSVFYGALRWLTVFIHLKSGIRFRARSQKLLWTTGD